MKFESRTKRVPSFLESNGVYFLKLSYLILLINVPVNKSYLPLRLEHIRLPLHYIKKGTSKVQNYELSPLSSEKKQFCLLKFEKFLLGKPNKY